MLAREIVQSALSQVPEVDDLSYFPAQILKALESTDRQVVEILSIVNPELVSAADGISIDLASNAGGYLLQPAIRYLRPFYLLDQDKLLTSVLIVSSYQSLQPSEHPSAVISGNKLMPVDPLQRQWDTALGERQWFRTGQLFRYSYVPIPAPLSSMDSPLASPELARLYLVESMKWYLLLLSPYVSQARLESGLASMMAAQRALTLLANKTVAKGVRISGYDGSTGD